MLFAGRETVERKMLQDRARKPDPPAVHLFARFEEMVIPFVKK
jgi:hypothetical protein